MNSKKPVQMSISFRLLSILTRLLVGYYLGRPIQGFPVWEPLEVRKGNAWCCHNYRDSIFAFEWQIAVCNEYAWAGSSFLFIQILPSSTYQPTPVTLSGISSATVNGRKRIAKENSPGIITYCGKVGGPQLAPPRPICW